MYIGVHRCTLIDLINLVNLANLINLVNLPNIINLANTCSLYPTAEFLFVLMVDRNFVHFNCQPKICSLQLSTENLFFYSPSINLVNTGKFDRWGNCEQIVNKWTG